MSTRIDRDRPMTVADVVEAVHAGRIGHADAMARLHLTTYAELVDTMHMHDLSLWAHRPRKIAPQTLDVLARACGTTTRAP